MKNKQDNYYNKKTVFGDNPLMEIIYELEEAIDYNIFLELEYISKDKLSDILDRHSETVKEFKIRLSKLIN